MTTQTITTIRTFISQNFLFRNDDVELSDAASLIDTGLIDSTGVLELVAFLEQEFGIQVADADIVPENLDSIISIARFVELKRTGSKIMAIVG